MTADATMYQLGQWMIFVSLTAFSVTIILMALKRWFGWFR